MCCAYLTIGTHSYLNTVMKPILGADHGTQDRDIKW